MSSTHESAAGPLVRPGAASQHPSALRALLLPIIVGGLAAGAIDITSAFLTFGRNMPKGIASGLLGAQAINGGFGVWCLGLALHFFITLFAAGLYCVSSIRMGFLRTNWIVCGVFYGIAIFLVMNLIVLPYSAFPRPVGPFTTGQLTFGLLAHIGMVGLPISASLRFFPKAKTFTN